MAANNKDIARRMFEEGWNKKNVDLIAELNAPDAVIEDPYNPVQAKGPESAKQYFNTYLKAFPDLNFKVDNQIAEGESVVTFLTCTGTHEGMLLGLPPTHKKFTTKAIVTFRIRDGKIFHSTTLWDALAMMRELGAGEMAAFGKAAAAAAPAGAR